MKLRSIKAQAQKGFTLIELMITVTIVGVLAALAVPAYQDYAIRAQVAEGIALASGGKVVVAEYFSNRGEFPADNAAAGYDGAVGKYVTGVEITGDDDTSVTIDATFGGSDVNAKLSGGTVGLVGAPDADSGVIVWSCSGSIDQKYLPSSCVSTASSAPAPTPGD